MRPHLTDLTNNGGSAEESEDGSTTTPAAYHQAMMCTRQAGKAIIRVVGRCNDAKENENLGKCWINPASKNMTRELTENNFRVESWINFLDEIGRERERLIGVLLTLGCYHVMKLSRNGVKDVIRVKRCYLYVSRNETWILEMRDT